MTASKRLAHVLCVFFSISAAQLCLGSPTEPKSKSTIQTEESPVPRREEVIGSERHPMAVTAVESTEDQVEKQAAYARDEQNTRNGLLTAIFTGISGVAAMLQLGLFMWQLTLMRKSLEDTRASADAAGIAAKAAELNARAAIGIELPVLRVRPPDDVVQTDGLIDDEPYGGLVNDGPLTKFSAMALTTIENHGRTPAFPTSISVGWQVAHRLPEAPHYSYTAPLNHAAVVKPADQLTIEQHYGVELTEEEIDSCTAGTSWLWLYGELKYRDFLHEEHVHRFCWRHADRNPPGGPAFFFFSSDGEPPLTYTRNI